MQLTPINGPVTSFLLERSDLLHVSLQIQKDNFGQNCDTSLVICVTCRDKFMKLCKGHAGTCDASVCRSKQFI